MRIANASSKKRIDRTITGCHRRGRLLVLLGWLLSTAVAAGTVRVDGAYVRGLPPGQTVTAAFMTLHNDSDKAKVLSGVQAPFAARAEIHQHSHHQGLMQMRKIEQLVIEPNSKQLFQSGGYHIMIFGLDRTLRSGERLPLVLQFEGGEQLTVMAIVRNIMDEMTER